MKPGFGNNIVSVALAIWLLITPLHLEIRNFLHTFYHNLEAPSAVLGHNASQSPHVSHKIIFDSHGVGEGNDHQHQLLDLVIGILGSIDSQELSDMCSMVFFDYKFLLPNQKGAIVIAPGANQTYILNSTGAMKPGHLQCPLKPPIHHRFC